MGRKARPRRLHDHPLFAALGAATELEPALSEKTQDTHHLRLMQLEDMTGMKLDDLLLKPAATFRAVSAKHFDSATTRKSFATSVLSVFGHNPEYARGHAKAHTEWKLIHRGQGGIKDTVRDNNPHHRKEVGEDDEHQEHA
jgi:hypothetical protein